MRTHRRATVLVALLVTAAASRLVAQEGEGHHGRSTSETLRPEHEGAGHWPQGWATLSFGVGNESFYYAGDPLGYSSQVSAPTFTASGGARLNPFLDVGLEAYGWVNGEQGGTLAIGGLMAIARVHPVGQFLYVKGGAGLATTSLQDSYYCNCYGPTYVGFAYSVGAGLEIPLGRRIALEPQADLFYQSYSGRSFSSYRERILHLGLGISFGFSH